LKANEFTSTMDQAANMMRAAYYKLAEAMEAISGPGRQQVLAIDEGTVDADALQLDAALLAAAPTVVAPTHCEFAPLPENGHRFVLARDGLYLEVRRPWLHCIQRISAVSSVTIPYGVIEPKMEMAFGKLGTALAQLQEFAELARAAAPVEAAASVLWNSDRNTWRLLVPETISATPGSISYKQVEPDANEHLVIDLHSHGCLDAFFSDTDNADDAGSVKIAGVYGNLNTASPTLTFRICVLGLYITAPVPAERVFLQPPGAKD